MYFYHAHAIALGVGSKSHGVCALPYTGGQAASQLTPYRSSEISCDLVRSEVSGEELENKNNSVDTYITKASVVLEKLDIPDILTADLVEASIIARYRKGDPEASIDTSASRFENLKIAGQVVTPQWAHDHFKTYDTYLNLQRAFINDKKQVLPLVVGCDLSLNANDPHDLHAAFDAYDKQTNMSRVGWTVVCSVVKKLDGFAPSSGIKSCGPIIVLPNARVYLGELIVWPWMRCLNMFRVEFDSGLSISGATVGANGTSYPPTGGAGPEP